MRFLLLTLILSNLIISPSFAKYIDDKNKAYANLTSIYTKLINDGYEMHSPYCGCALYSFNNHLYFDNKNCTYEILNHRQRGKRLELAHIVPPSLYAKDLPCKNKCREENNKTFIKRDIDLHNIFPFLGELTSIRLSYKFVEKLKVQGLHIKYGNCVFDIDKVHKEIVPPDISRGIIARAYLYMNQTYKLNIKSSEIDLFTKWDKIHKVTKEECARNKAIYDVQGNYNDFISRKCSYFK